MRIHPVFKRFIMQEATDKWDKILKKDGIKEGIEGGVCWSTSQTFCELLKKYGIKCKIEMV